MKTRSFLILVLLVFFGNSLFAQEEKSKPIQDFKISLEKTSDGIALKSFQGSAWNALSFTLKTDQLQAIDEYGMTVLSDVAIDKSSSLADFLFTIKLTDEGVQLQGIKGTAWQQLSFSLSVNQKQVINQFGMSNPD